MSSANVPCPVCNTTIPINTQALLTGAKFNCPNVDCDASIALAAESKPVVKDTIETFEELKKGAGGKEG